MQIAVTGALHDALKTCWDIERQLIEIGERSDAQRKYDLVQCRRRFAEQMGEINQLIDRENALQNEPERVQEMMRLFSSFRFAIGQHQASWPAVCIDEDSEAYAASARGTLARSQLFWDWCRHNLGFSRL